MQQMLYLALSKKNYYLGPVWKAMGAQCFARASRIHAFVSIQKSLIGLNYCQLERMMLICLKQ